MVYLWTNGEERIAKDDEDYDGMTNVKLKLLAKFVKCSVT